MENTQPTLQEIREYFERIHGKNCVKVYERQLQVPPHISTWKNKQRKKPVRTVPQGINTPITQ